MSDKLKKQPLEETELNAAIDSDIKDYDEDFVCSPEFPNGCEELAKD